MKRSTVWLLSSLLLGAAAWANTHPYAGQDARRIASLSAQDIEDLTEGRGWGFAKSAELNGYPGPAHVLELADEIALSEDQKREIEAIFAEMNANARELGAAFIAAEAEIDAAFEEGSITPERLNELTQAAGQAWSELRAVHLAAHLRAAPILTRHQTMLYNRARGYDAGGDHDGHGHE